jgi:hypothetical protein
MCAIDWSTAGIPGGIPSGSWTQSGSTIQASTYGNGSTDATSGIQSALNSCGGTSSAGKFVLLSAGTFLIDGQLSVPSYCALRGAGANQTILNSENTSNTPLYMGSGGPNCGTYSGGACSYPTTVSITAGYQAGSTLITVSSASGITAGMYLLIDQINDGTFVTNYGGEGTCSYCDYGQTSNGTRCQGQMAEVEAVNGNVLTISPPLYVTYSNTPEAISFSMNKYSGIENLQVYANNSHSGSASDASDITITGCAYCWVSGVEDNYTDGDHVRLYADFHDEIVNSYFSNAYLHAAGNYDSDIALGGKTTGCLVQNNICERLHGACTMLEWGAAGNVIAYNYSFGAFDNSAPDVLMMDFSTHGGHPQFNLWEGNVVQKAEPDNIWGSGANDTLLRNWSLGLTKICNPTSGRGTVTCSGANGWTSTQANWALAINYLDNDFNLIGNVVGSSAQESNGQTQVDMAWAVCGPSPCGSNSRPYSSDVFGTTWGYQTAGDSGGTSGDTLQPYTTRFVHGEYSNISGSIIWASGVTQSLPPSFYLSSKPSWWLGGMPWPAIGPDVTGGSGPGGHVYSTTAGNPAQYCYTAVMGGTDGTGSPLTFNANSCYAATAPNPPGNVTAVAH